MMLSVPVFSVGQQIDTLKVFVDSAATGIKSRTLMVSLQPEPQSARTRVENEIVTPGSFGIYMDQDFLFRFPFSKNEDRNYTQGTAFSYSHPDLLKSIFFWPLRMINKYHRYTPYSSTFSFGATAFTPLKIDSINPIIGDRPFSVLLYISTSSTAIRQKSFYKGEKLKVINIYNTYSFTYGMLGTNLGYEFQSFAHKSIVKGRPTDPKGWDTQISQGGYPAFLFDYNRFRPLIELTDLQNSENSYFDLGWNFGGSIGYYERIVTGLYTRVGKLKKINQARWNGGWSSLSNASFQLFDPTAPKKNKIRDHEFFFYGKANAIFMLRNSLLVGQRFKESEYTLEPQWTKTALAEFEWGFVYAFSRYSKNLIGPKTWALQYRTVYRSPEFDSKLFPVRWHYFGGLALFIPVR
jgi:hypothetical protein